MFFDADLDIPPSQIKRFIKFLQNGYDVVIGSKYLPGARVRYSEKEGYSASGTERSLNYCLSLTSAILRSDSRCLREKS